MAMNTCRICDGSKTYINGRNENIPCPHCNGTGLSLHDYTPEEASRWIRGYEQGLYDRTHGIDNPNHEIFQLN